jgi:hypothetical protein
MTKHNRSPACFFSQIGVRGLQGLQARRHRRFAAVRDAFEKRTEKFHGVFRLPLLPLHAVHHHRDSGTTSD